MDTSTWTIQPKKKKKLKPKKPVVRTHRRSSSTATIGPGKPWPPVVNEEVRKRRTGLYPKAQKD